MIKLRVFSVGACERGEEEGMRLETVFLRENGLSGGVGGVLTTKDLTEVADSAGDVMILGSDGDCRLNQDLNMWVEVSLLLLLLVEESGSKDLSKLADRLCRFELFLESPEVNVELRRLSSEVPFFRDLNEVKERVRLDCGAAKGS